jgi:hypothetical protein
MRALWGPTASLTPDAQRLSGARCGASREGQGEWCGYGRPAGPRGSGGRSGGPPTLWRVLISMTKTIP